MRSGIAIRTVTLLDQGEVYRGQVFHDGHLWEGNSTGGVANYRLDIYAADGSRILASARVPHTQEFLYPFGPRAIIIVGKHFTDHCGWLTYHSVARFRQGRLHVKTHAMPMALQIEQFGGRDGRIYFNETGSRKVFRWTRRGARPLAPDIHLPGVMLPCDRFIFVLERNRISPGAENVVKIDLFSQRIERTFTEPRNKLSTMIDLPGFPWIAAVETWPIRSYSSTRRATRSPERLPRRAIRSTWPTSATAWSSSAETRSDCASSTLRPVAPL